jgi:hypothetical protein
MAVPMRATLVMAEGGQGVNRAVPFGGSPAHGPSRCGRGHAMLSGKQEDCMPLKPLELREMTPEEREKRDLAIKQARESGKADAAEKAVKLRPLPAKKK